MIYIPTFTNIGQYSNIREVWSIFATIRIFKHSSIFVNIQIFIKNSQIVLIFNYFRYSITFANIDYENLLLFEYWSIFTTTEILNYILTLGDIVQYTNIRQHLSTFATFQIFEHSSIFVNIQIFGNHNQISLLFCYFLIFERSLFSTVNIKIFVKSNQILLNSSYLSWISTNK